MSPSGFHFEAFGDTKEEFKKTPGGKKLPMEVWKAADAYRRILKYFANDKK